MPVGTVKHKGWAGLETRRLAFLRHCLHAHYDLETVQWVLTFRKGFTILKLAGHTALLETAETSMAVK